MDIFRRCFSSRPLEFTPPKLNRASKAQSCLQSTRSAVAIPSFPFLKDCPTANDLLRRLNPFRTATPPSQALLGDVLLRWIDFDHWLLSAEIRAGKLGISFATRCQKTPRSPRSSSADRNHAARQAIWTTRQAIRCDHSPRTKAGRRQLDATGPKSSCSTQRKGFDSKSSWTQSREYLSARATSSRWYNPAGTKPQRAS